jgi:hypothetical protein
MMIFIIRMDLLISESQYKLILLESSYSNLTQSVKELKDFGNKVVRIALKKFGLNLRLLSTWGASVGGLVMPLDNFIRTGEFNLTDEQSYLILAGVSAFLFFETRRQKIGIFAKIKKEGLENEFNRVLEVGERLKSAFVGFLNSLNITISSVMELAAYSFLIPIITDIIDYLEPSSDIIEISKLISKRLIAAGGVIISSEMLFKVIQKILRRFK